MPRLDPFNDPPAQQDQWPEVPKELLERLERAFAPRCMDEGENLEHHHRYAGKVELVAYLRSVRDSQQLPEVA